jgi:hypothetical protein
MVQQCIRGRVEYVDQAEGRMRVNGISDMWAILTFGWFMAENK